MKKTEEKRNLYTNNMTKHDREKKRQNHKYIHTLRTTKEHCAALTGTEKKNQNRYRRAICPIEEFEYVNV